jgi:hypothetical protein
MELQASKYLRDTLKITLNEVYIEKDEEKQRILQIEQHVEEVFKSIPDSTKEGEHLQTEENIGIISHEMENYKSHITDLITLLKPSTPPEVRSQREKEVVGNIDDMA